MVSLLDNAPGCLRIRLADAWLTPAFQRSHAFTALLLVLLGHLFAAQQYRRVECFLDAGDARGRKAVERAGFLLEGVLRKHRVLRGANVDTALYSLTNSDWRDGGAGERLRAKLRPPGGISAPTRKVGLVGKKND